MSGFILACSAAPQLYYTSPHCHQALSDPLLFNIPLEEKIANLAVMMIMTLLVPLPPPIDLRRNINYLQLYSHSRYTIKLCIIKKASL